MNRELIVVATIKSWNIQNFRHLRDKFSDDYDFILIENQSELSYQYLADLSPRYIFFPHWSWIIPEKVYGNFECVLFHMTDLPFGRGGSPLQNLIVRDFEKTKISALKVSKELDAGPIYLKKDLSLEGTAKEIFLRASDIIFKEMIPVILEEKPVPIAQSGMPTAFKRRCKEDGNLISLKDLKEIYNYIRMLDAEGYPPAFLETDNFVFDFSRASLKEDGIFADVFIREKKKDE